MENRLDFRSDAAPYRTTYPDKKEVAHGYTSACSILIVRSNSPGIQSIGFVHFAALSKWGETGEAERSQKYLSDSQVKLKFILSMLFCRVGGQLSFPPPFPPT